MYRLLFGLFLSLSFFISPAVSQAAGLVPCGGPTEHPCQTCDVVAMTNEIIQWLIIIMSTVAAIIIVYAGVRLVTSGGNTHAAEEAKSMMNNVIIGYIILLSGWLIVDYVMKTLVANDPTATFGVWNKLTCTTQDVPGYNKQVAIEYNLGQCDVGPSGDHVLCQTQSNACTANGGIPKVNSSDPKNYSVDCSPVNGTFTGVVGGGVQCSPGNNACSVSALMSAGLTSNQANVMSCIAMTESSGNPNTPPYNQTHPGSPSSACGTFQIVGSTWRSTAVGSCSSFSNCQNYLCNAQTAARLVQQSGYSPWTCPGCNARAAGCVSRYGG